jgi:hypothetical protein
MGYFYCLDFVRRKAAAALLINQHVKPAFRFASSQIDQMSSALRKRVGLLRELLPFEDPNFGLDEGWARFYPYSDTSRAGETLTLSLRIMNHSPRPRSFRVRLHLPKTWTVTWLRPNPIRVEARLEAAQEIKVTVPTSASPGIHVLTADVSWGDWELREWTEAMVTVVRDDGDH